MRVELNSCLWWRPRQRGVGLGS